MKPTYRILNKQLTFAGIDRPMFVCALMFAPIIWIKYNLLMGMGFFCLLAALGRMKAKDPVAMQLLVSVGRYKPYYDPALREPFVVRYVASQEKQL